jgi:hypothetical protein
MPEQGVKVIGSSSRSSSPGGDPAEDPKPKKFQNGWSKELERLMADWSDIAVCYRWLHDKSDKTYHTKTLSISLPVIFLSTLSGFSNIGVQAILETEESKKYASFAIAGVSLLAGLLTTVGDRLRYAQLEESHRVAAISWGKFQRLIAVELALKPDDRMDSLDFLKICRGELDRLIEQSPAIPKESIALFEKKFGSIKDLKKPDICGQLEHTRVFESSETRLKQAAVEAALMLKHRKQALTELVAPTVEGRIKRELETRISEAIEARKERLEEEIDRKRQEAKKAQDEYERVLEERKKKIEEEIELEKKRHTPVVTVHSGDGQAQMSKAITNQFESRLQKKSGIENRNPNNRNPFSNPVTQSESGSDSINLNEIIIVGKE